MPLRQSNPLIRGFRASIPKLEWQPGSAFSFVPWRPYLAFALRPVARRLFSAAFSQRHEIAVEASSDQRGRGGWAKANSYALLLGRLDGRISTLLSERRMQLRATQPAKRLLHACDNNGTISQNPSVSLLWLTPNLFWEKKFGLD